MKSRKYSNAVLVINQYFANNTSFFSIHNSCSYLRENCIKRSCLYVLVAGPWRCGPAHVQTL